MNEDDSEEEYGCEWCRNDMPFKDDGHCPKCDAWYPDSNDGD